MMKEEKLIFVLGAYLKQHRKIIFLLPCFVLISSFVFYLYSLPAEAAVYAGLLCLCPGTIVAAFDFIHYYRKHKKLCRMRTVSYTHLDVYKRQKRYWLQRRPI